MNFTLKKSNLNFSVKTAETMPANPGTGNHIIAITTTPMKNWIMSPDIPTKPPRNDGDIWIPYSVNGAVLNAVKNGGLMINPLTAMQYVDGVWAGVPEMVYPDGKKIKFLYNFGNECVALTGGWEARAQSHSSDFTNIISPDLKKAGDGFIATLSSTAARSGVVEVQKDIDLTNVKKVIFDFASIKASGATSEYRGGRLVCSVLARSAQRFQSGATKYVEKIYTSTVTETDVAMEIDVSDLTGSYDIALGLAVRAESNTTNTVSAHCRAVKLEV